MHEFNRLFGVYFFDFAPVLIYTLAMTQLVLELGQQTTIQLNFNIRSTPLAELWLERMQYRNKWHMDDPTRFYGFGTMAQETSRAENMIKQCITVINSYDHIIDREYTSLDDQDLLNYLHNIFENYHGLLDQQNTTWWTDAPDHVRKALADLNIAVHRCESLAENNPARLVCTWFGMPKDHKLDPVIASNYGTTQNEFGTVYLNYVEIGKTLEDLTRDQDKYIGDDAFRPFEYYSADFTVAFNNYNHIRNLPAMKKYHEQHLDFFVAHGVGSVYNVKALPLRFPVADLEDSRPQHELLALISQNQFVKQVFIR
jgi:hypothetical protein